MSAILSVAVDDKDIDTLIEGLPPEEMDVVAALSVMLAMLPQGRVEALLSLAERAGPANFDRCALGGVAAFYARVARRTVVRQSDTLATAIYALVANTGAADRAPLREAE